MMTEYKVMDDGIYKNIPCGEDVCTQELIMPKETFIEAFNKYIRFQPNGDMRCMDCEREFPKKENTNTCPFCGSTNLKPILIDMLYEQFYDLCRDGIMKL